MDILLLCPANIATGGTESIHNLACHLNKAGAYARIWYRGKNLTSPQPKQYAFYGVPYITEYPEGFKGCIIFPEVWANEIVLPQYKDNLVAVSWQGVDVYDWNNPVDKRGIYLQRKDALHIACLEYAMETLKERGLNPFRIQEVLGNEFFDIPDTPTDRTDIVLYNPVSIKLTDFQKQVMKKCDELYRVRFKPIAGYNRRQVIDLFRHSKLYLDLGVFSGRERLPREAVMCGCAIITSDMGAAKRYIDNPIPDKYKVSTVDQAVNMVNYVLAAYKDCKSDFDYYRQALRQEKANYEKDVEVLYNEILSHSTSV